tara:strand:- start:4508 stop:5164 length:657 start_codon:yes stop_codon:yes gene_type:complete|mmetsp:Transcript_10863/g.47050  ORF Transcript_10863/g.47050 Transcript_10863/m.47050 type:complete len:219 (-) Transcript_10863:2540-3196(-)
MATACTNSFRHVGASRAAERLSSSRSSYVSTAPVSVISRRRVAKKVETAITARLRPGRQGVQRIYRMATEKSQINVYEYLESIGVPRVNALQVQSRASEWFEFENAKAGGDKDAPFGVEQMAAVVDFLKEKGVEESDVGSLVCAHPPVLAYSVERRIAPLFAYLDELGMDADRAVAALRKRPNLLGLDPDNNMRRMVDYLQSTGKTQEEALDLLLTSL